MTQFLKDRASDSEEVVTPLMPDGTYLSRNSATLGPINFHASYRWCWDLTHESSCIKSQIIANTCIPMPTGKLPFICKGNNLQK
eukprot:UN4216